MAQVVVYLLSFAAFLANPLALLFLWIAASPVVANFLDRPFLNPFFGSYLLTDAHLKLAGGFAFHELFAYDRIVLLLLVAWLAYAGSLKPMTGRWLDRAFLAFLAALLFGCARSLNPAHALKVVVDSFGLCYAAYLIGKSPAVREQDEGVALAAIAALGVALIATGLVEYAVHGNPGGYRITGPFRYWVTYGMVLLIAYFVFLYKLNTLEVYGGRELFYYAAMALVIVCVFLTGTRTVFLGLIVGTAITCILGFRHLNRKTLFFYMFLVLFAIGGIVGNSERIASSAFYRERLSNVMSAEGRMETYQVAARMFLANPVAGIGVRNFQEEMEGYSSGVEIVHSVFGKTTLHNSFLVVMVETGLAGTIPFLVMLAAAARAVCRMASSPGRNDRLWGLVMMGMTVSYLIGGLTFDPFFEPSIDNKLYYLCLGMTVGKLSSRDEPAGEAAEPAWYEAG